MDGIAGVFSCVYFYDEFGFNVLFIMLRFLSPTVQSLTLNGHSMSILIYINV